MRSKIKKIVGFFANYWKMIFQDPSVNHLRFLHSHTPKYRSYTELKRRQKRIRTFASLFALVLVSLGVGLVVGPIFFPKPIEPEVYIPNGKGDILLANISRNQATVVFKTLDGANGNKPLATKAAVEVYSDPSYTNLVRRSKEDDYAVTHTILADALQEGVTYYVKISATDASEHAKSVSFWGEGNNDPIKFFTAGDLITACDNQTNAANSQSNIVVTKISQPVAQPVDAESGDDKTLRIYDVQNENHLQPDNKVQTIISWSTNFPASTELVMSEGNDGQQISLPLPNQSPSQKHQIVLTTLKAGVTYYFKVKSVDASGNTVLSDEYSLKTPNPEESVFHKIKDNVNDLFGRVGL